MNMVLPSSPELRSWILWKFAQSPGRSLTRVCRVFLQAHGRRHGEHVSAMEILLNRLTAWSVDVLLPYKGFRFPEYDLG